MIGFRGASRYIAPEFYDCFVLECRALKRVQLPQDVVGAMLFLASPLSDFMTGQSIGVDGGMTCYPGFEAGG